MIYVGPFLDIKNKIREPLSVKESIGLYQNCDIFEKMIMCVCVCVEE